MALKTSTFFDLKTCLRSKAPHSNDTESRRPTPTIFGLSLHLLINCWMLLDSPIQITALSGRLLVVFCVYTWLVQLPLYHRITCIVNSFVGADRRATARTTTSLSHAAIRQNKKIQALGTEQSSLISFTLMPKARAEEVRRSRAPLSKGSVEMLQA